MRKLALLWLLLIAAAVPAQARWYQVEIIVFARNTPESGATEFWPEDPGAPAMAQAQRLLSPGAGDEAYARLPRSELTLDGLYGGLVASRGQFEPLLHLAWLQPVTDEHQAVPVYLGTGRGSSGGPPALEGTLRLSAGRYLHAELDLLLTSVVEGANTGPPSGASASGGPGYRSYRLRDHRRMRSGELHYIDHPLMGVLLLVKPYALPGAVEQDEPDQQERDDTPPPGGN